jgi:hypothetical protein
MPRIDSPHRLEVRAAHLGGFSGRVSRRKRTTPAAARYATAPLSTSQTPIKDAATGARQTTAAFVKERRSLPALSLLVPGRSWRGWRGVLAFIRKGELGS